MDLWRYVLEQDRGHDLAKPGRGEIWFQALPVSVSEVAAPRAWSRTTGEEWSRCVCALRSLGERLKGVRPGLPSGVDAVAADGTVSRYMRGFRVTLYDEVADRQALIAATFNGVRVVASGPVEKDAPEFTPFFRRVFGSLVDAVSAQVCGTCGRPLAPTAGGRPSRRETCKTCQQAKAWAGKSKQEKRRIWKEQYLKHRSVAARAKLEFNTDEKGE